MESLNYFDGIKGIDLAEAFIEGRDDPVILNSPFKVRNVLFGQNYETKSTAGAFDLAIKSNYKESCWISNHGIFEHDGSPRGLYFAAMIDGCYNDPAIESVARHGYAPAQAFMARTTSGIDKMRWASASAQQGDPEGLYQLALCYLDHGLIDGARVLLRSAAEMGHIDALLEMAPILNTFDDEAFWFRYMIPVLDKQRGIHGIWEVFQKTAFERSFVRRSPEQCLKFYIGNQTWCCHAHFHDGGDDESWFGMDCDQLTRRVDAPAREAIHAFSLVAMRCRLYKDLRVLISQYIWRMRDAWIPVGEPCPKKWRG